MEEHVDGYERTGEEHLVEFHFLRLKVTSEHFLKDDFKGFLLHKIVQDDSKDLWKD